jgi:hypothetical protein
MSEPSGVNALARLDKAVSLLKEARTLDEVGKIRATAAAASEYARAEKLGDEAIHYANEIRVRAARRAGELLAQMTEKAKGTQLAGRSIGGLPVIPPKPQNAPPTLKEMGITKAESKRWQDIAKIPEDRFEAIVRGEKVPTETAVAKQSEPKPKPATPRESPFVDDDPRATRSKFTTICKQLIEIDDPRVCARRFQTPLSRFHTSKYQDEYLEAAKAAAEWLTAFLHEWTKKGTIDVEAVRAAR